MKAPIDTERTPGRPDRHGPVTPPPAAPDGAQFEADLLLYMTGQSDPNADILADAGTPCIPEGAER